jgi:hypothetical protein
VVLNDVSRKQAFLTHLSVSMIIFFVLLYLIAFEWFPSFYYRLDDGYMGTAVIFFVDVVLGPGLTLLAFKPGKPGLKFDMAAIIVFQLIALSWGIKSVYEDRPAVTVFYDGRFLALTQTVSEGVDQEKINAGMSGDQKLAYLHSPENYNEKSKFMLEAYRQGVSAEYYYGARFEPVDEMNVKKILEYKLELDDLKAEHPDNAKVLSEYFESRPDYLEKYSFYPIRSRFNSGVAVFDPVALRVVDVIYVTTYMFAKAPDLGARGLGLTETGEPLGEE